jgi:hypothetical protein
VTQKVCIVGGGASGVALAWCLAKAQQQKQKPSDQYQITLIHDVLIEQNGQPQPGIPSLGGHSRSVAVTVNGTQYWIDLGVQMVAPFMYPNMMSMLLLPQFSSVVMDDVPLKVSCAFPPTSPNGPAQYWGNFPGYNTTPLFQQGSADAATFETLMKVEPGLPVALDSLLGAENDLFKNFALFETYFLDPYMSIMNGYGAALLDEVYVPEVAFLFNQDFASFTNWSSNFKRFHYGAMQWVQMMAKDAVASLPQGAINFITGATVTEVYPGPNGPSVNWEVNGSSQGPQTFDVVVLTTDMATNGTLLDNAQNPLQSFYDEYVGEKIWGLIPGFCYLHQDASILAPGMPSPPQETLQFTAYWATQTQPFDLELSWTTYSYKNLMGVEDPEFEYYLTMYGFDPTQRTDIPIPKNPIAPTPMNWTHGMWLPSFMWDQKLRMRDVQSISPYYEPLPNQKQTGIYFAGNNLTMDSEEGALVSAMAVASYAFGVDAIDTVLNGRIFDSQALLARVFYLGLFNLMFPGFDLDFSKMLGVLSRG